MCLVFLYVVIREICKEIVILLNLKIYENVMNNERWIFDFRDDIWLKKDKISWSINCMNRNRWNGLNSVRDNYKI